MAYEKIQIHKLDAARRIKNFKRVVADEKEYNRIIEHLNLLASGEITGRTIGDRRKVKLLDMFALFLKNCQKSISKLTLEDLRKFKEDLLNDRIRKENGEPYSDETKEDCTETLARYLEVSYSKKANLFNSKYQKFRKWFVIRATRKTPETLSEAEVIKLIENCKSLEGKYILSVLFDSGARVEEFLNIRFEDIEAPTGKFPYFKFDFKEEYSKTDGRKIGLYWSKSSEIILKYLASIEKKDNKEQVLAQTYDAIRMFLSRIGLKVLGRKINPHMFRKSSASYYADKMNRQQLCYRFGWKFSSDMPDIYINRAMVEEAKVKDVILNDDLNVIKKENQELKTKFDLSQKDMESLKKRLDEQDAINSNLKQIFDELQGKKKLEANTEFLKLLFKLSGKEITASA